MFWLFTGNRKISLLYCSPIFSFVYITYDRIKVLLKNSTHMDLQSVQHVASTVHPQTKNKIYKERKHFLFTLDVLFFPSEQQKNEMNHGGALSLSLLTTLKTPAFHRDILIGRELIMSSPHRWPRQMASSSGLCRYGARVDCCWGWTRRSWGHCQRECHHACRCWGRGRGGGKWG